MSTPSRSALPLTTSSCAGTVVRLLGLSCFAATAQAQITTEELMAQYTPLERDLAVAFTQLYDFLSESSVPCESQDEDCPAFDTYDTLYYLIDGGESPYGYLHATPEALDDGLRWLAPEEMFALAPLATGFANSQVGALNNRIGANRYLSRSQLLGHAMLRDSLRQGYASSDGAGTPGEAGLSRFNVFFDGSFGFGKRSDTTLGSGAENAFDFDSREFSIGVDWRHSDSLVTGAMLGYTDRSVDFNSETSAASGGIDASGFSVLGFAQWDSLRWYGNFTLGYQQLDYDTFRRISLASESSPGSFFAPESVAEAAPDGDGLLLSAGAGLPWRHGAWSTEVYVNAVWQKQDIGAFAETLTQIDPDQSTTGIAYNVGKQSLKSFDTALGVNLQYVATPSFGVLIPFVRAEYHRELEDSARRLELGAMGIDDVPDGDAAALDAFTFSVRSDTPDKSFVSAAAGVSAVLRGSSRVDAAGVGGGLQAYLQYSTTFGLARSDSSAVGLGLRYEF